MKNEGINSEKEFLTRFLKNKKGQWQVALAEAGTAIKGKIDAFKESQRIKKEQRKTEKLRKQQEKTAQQSSNINKNLVAAAGAGAVGGGIVRGAAGRVSKRDNFRDFFRGMVDRGRGNTAAVSFFFVIVLLIHTIDALSRFVMDLKARALLYIILMMWGYFIFRNPNLGFDTRTFTTCMLLSLWTFYVPMIRTWLPRNPSLTLIFDGIILFAPLWVIFVFFSAQHVRWIRILFSIWLTFWIVFFFLWYFNEMDDVMKTGTLRPIDTFRPVNEVWKELRTTGRSYWRSTFQTFKNMPQTAQKWWNQSMEYATGGYYHGQEELVEEPLGVFLDDVETTSEEYYAYDPITIWGTLKAKNIGKDPIRVTVDCGIDNWEDVEEGLREPKISPNVEFDMEGYDQIDIDCIFKEGLTTGYYDISLNATFEFETDARLLTYWMDSERYRAITRQDRDVFDEYDIPEDEPEAYFTSGPVAVGIGVGKPPIKVGGEVVRPRLGITIERNWYEGKIARINYIIIHLPKEMTLDLDSCSEEVQRGGREGEFNTYRIFGNDKFVNIEDFKTIICRFNEVKPSILDPTPVTLRYIKVNVDYDYVIYETIEIDVNEHPKKELEEFNGEVSEEISETDVGRDYKEKGLCYDDDTGRARFDECANEDQLREYYKYKGVCSLEFISCSEEFGNNWACKNGACVEKDCTTPNGEGICLDPCTTLCKKGSCIKGYCPGETSNVCCVS